MVTGAVSGRESLTSRRMHRTAGVEFDAVGEALVKVRDPWGLKP
jgi:hypothetical protein